ncbi:hypothetical protein [Thauera sinica]|uniref:Uncharacterized protein n=1 Tax=Thauera sinica TaxID=2665146 RepID=A0ABW1AS55_9RHOO|nr:hypothetical protein [Thauera sp. K11]ATE60169.1 hypothetical protein CCZ27_09600 [Thauera sp. K11]
MITLAAAAAFFVIDPCPTVRWPVTVRIPADGGPADFRFEADIRVHSEEAYARVLPPEADAPFLPDDVPALSKKTMAEVLQENAHYLPMHVVGWHGVIDAQGKPVSVESLPEQILYGPYGIALSRGLWRAINEVRYGLDPYQPGATAGNSAPSPDAGRNSVSSATAPTK